MEEMIEGREFSIGILEDQALPPIEIIPKSGFYDYENKYQEGATVEICPAEISGVLTATRCEASGQACARGFKAGVLLAESDFMVNVAGTADIYCIEANTLPGMTPTSLFPQEAAAMGIDYNTLCDRLAQLAADKRN
ncbi:MAG: hypothetical protein U5K84_11465 [Alkalibacterium sp.]|nr:hypothetical protein [Alkalibacterium sp.]